ncbi:hypothetical protein D8M03_10380, partial [Lysinibacillus endophyticus]
NARSALTTTGGVGKRALFALADCPEVVEELAFAARQLEMRRRLVQARHALETSTRRRSLPS